MFRAGRVAVAGGRRAARAGERARGVAAGRSCRKTRSTRRRVGSALRGWSWCWCCLGAAALGAGFQVGRGWWCAGVICAACWLVVVRCCRAAAWRWCRCCLGAAALGAGFQAWRGRWCAVAVCAVRLLVVVRCCRASAGSGVRPCRGRAAWPSLVRVLVRRWLKRCGAASGARVGDLTRARVVCLRTRAGCLPSP